MKTILLSSHYSGTPGAPTDKFYDYLKAKHALITIRHPLFPNSKTKSEIITKKRTINYKIPPIAQYLTEGIITLMLYYQMSQKRPKVDLAICFDSLAFLNLFIFKKIYRVNKIVFYNIDFSRKRFSSQILNFIYLWLNQFAYKKSDHVFSLYQTFIKEMDPSQNYIKKYSIIKSTVWLSKIILPTIKLSNSIVYAGSLSYGSNNFKPLLQELKKLHDNHINFTFDIYGPYFEKTELPTLVNKLGLSKQVNFKGAIENKLLTEQILPKYKIAVSPYILKKTKNTPDHTFSGDDLTAKIVDYLAAGLPVITTKINNGFTQIQTNKIGYLVKKQDDWSRYLELLLTNPKIYKIYSKNARKYSTNYDIDKILSPIINELLA